MTYEVRRYFTVLAKDGTKHTESYWTDVDYHVAFAASSRDGVIDDAGWALYSRADSGELTWLCDCGTKEDAERILNAFNMVDRAAAGSQPTPKTTEEVWITLRIKSELPIETDAKAFAETLAQALFFDDMERVGVMDFMTDSHEVEVIEVEAGDDIYEQE